MWHHLLLDNPNSIIVWQCIYNDIRYNDPECTSPYLNGKVRSVICLPGRSLNCVLIKWRSCGLVSQVLILLVNSYQTISSMNSVLHNEVNCVLVRPYFRHVACAVCLSKYCVALVIVRLKAS